MKFVIFGLKNHKTNFNSYIFFSHAGIKSVGVNLNFAGNWKENFARMTMNVAKGVIVSRGKMKSHT